jgi:hypothetical protein
MDDFDENNKIEFGFNLGTKTMDLSSPETRVFDNGMNLALKSTT